MRPPYYWPPNAPPTDDRSSLVFVFEQNGYEICQRGDVEDGFEKVALYIDSKGKAKHAARQLKSGMWTSKLGPNVDIAHTLEALEGTHYGRAQIIMRRRYPSAPVSNPQTSDHGAQQG